MARDRGPRGGVSTLSKGFDEVRVDIDDGPSVEITKDGPRAVRVARVFGVRGTGAARLWFALSASSVPKYGDTHPYIEGLPVSRVHAVLEEGSTDIATVTIEYFYPTGGNLHFANIEDVREAPVPQLEITSTVQPSTTEFNWVGGIKERIYLDYERTDPDSGTTTPLPTQPGKVEYQLPMTVFRYMRREPADAFVGDNAREFVGKINSNTPMFGDGSRYWMCTRLDGVSDDAGQSYNTTYEFQRHPDTWDATVIYVDPETGRAVLDPIDGVGIKTVQIYREADFERLDLTI